MSEDQGDTSQIMTENITNLVQNGLNMFIDQVEDSEDGNFYPFYQIWDSDGESRFQVYTEMRSSPEELEAEFRQKYPKMLAYFGCFPILWKGDEEPVDSVIIRVFAMDSPSHVTFLHRYEYQDGTVSFIEGLEIIDTQPNPFAGFV